jgi:integrase/recombinase XerD
MARPNNQAWKENHTMENQVTHYLESLQDERQFSANTIAAYRNDLKQLTDFLQRLDGDADVEAIGSWSDLTDDHFAAFLAYLQDREYAQATVARKTAASKSFFAYLLDKEIINEPVGTDISSPKVAKYTPIVMTREEINRLLEEPLRDEPNRPEAIRDRAMLELLYATGMRVGEMVALNIQDVDVEKQEIRCVGKSGRERDIPMNESAFAAVRDYINNARPYLSDPDTESLFVNHRGGRLTRQGFWLILKSYAEHIGIHGITPHTLRHTYAIHALQDGQTVREVQQTLGHVSPSTTNLYVEMANTEGLAAS